MTVIGLLRRLPVSKLEGMEGEHVAGGPQGPCSGSKVFRSPAYSLHAADVVDVLRMWVASMD